MKKAKRDIHQEITDRLIEIMEKVDDSWQLPWYTVSTIYGENPLTIPQNAVTDHKYSGINIINLWLTSAVQGYGSARFATYKQWSDKGCQVRKGEKGTTIVKFKVIEKERENNDGEKETFGIPILKHFTVFSAEQVDGTEAPVTHEPLPEDLRHQQTEQFVANCKVNVEHGGNKAYHAYNLGTRESTIRMPAYAQFKSWQKYYATLLHELVHYTGYKNDRREQESKNFKNEKERYAFEELVAELGSCFLCAQLGIEPEPREDHAQYLSNWLKSLKADKKYIFKAASAASKAVEYLNNLQITDN